MNRDRNGLCAGLCGSAVFGVCCFTPLLVVVFSAFGVSAWLDWADFVLLPGLSLFAVLAIVSWIRLRRRRPNLTH